MNYTKDLLRIILRGIYPELLKMLCLGIGVTDQSLVVASPYTDPEKRSELTLFAFFSSEV